MISLRIILSALMLLVFMSHVSAFWGSSGYFGQQNPRFRSSYYSSPSYGSSYGSSYGLSSYSPWSFGGGGDFMDDFYGGYGGGSYWGDNDMDDIYERSAYGRGGWM